MQDASVQQPQQPGQAKENKPVEDGCQEFWEMHDDFEQASEGENQQGSGGVNQQDAAALGNNLDNNSRNDVIVQNTCNPNAGPSGYGLYQPLI